jgi:hypothetical protein
MADTPSPETPSHYYWSYEGFYYYAYYILVPRDGTCGGFFIYYNEGYYWLSVYWDGYFLFVGYKGFIVKRS